MSSISTQRLFYFSGDSVGSLSRKASEQDETFLKAFDHAMLGSGIRIALGPFKFLYPLMDKQWIRSCRMTYQLAETYVNKALQHRQVTMKAKEKETEPSLKSYILLYGIAEQTNDKIELRNGILQALMAAQETTASLISNVFFLLSRHPRVWHRLRKEVVTYPREEGLGSKLPPSLALPQQRSQRE